MKMVLCLVVLLSLSACDNGTWVDTMGPTCKNGKVAENQINKEINGIAKATCMASGKSFTGDVQCKGDDVQVKCE